MMKSTLLNQKGLPERGTARDWSRLFGPDEGTIRRACVAGTLPHTMIGQYRVIEKSAIIAWLQAGFPRMGRPRKTPQTKEVMNP